jgi:hypothetical protein
MGWQEMRKGSKTITMRGEKTKRLPGMMKKRPDMEKRLNM